MDAEWNSLSDEDTLSEAMARLQVRNSTPVIVDDSAAAVEELTSRIPDGAGVVTGLSTTLKQIGFIDGLKMGEHSCDDWKDYILNEETLE
ncbi:MAG: LUD domain-containing protein, partial [Chloroflexota bacterium]